MNSLPADFANINTINELIKTSGNINREYTEYTNTKYNGTLSKKGTLLHFAAIHGHMDTVKYLVESGANIHVINDTFGTVLHFAVTGPSVEIVKYLLDKGAKIEFCDCFGSTPLQYAAANNKFDVVRYLLDCGADKYHINDNGDNAAKMAFDRKYDDIGQYIESYEFVESKGVYDQ